MSIKKDIKDLAFYDYRSHVPGVICEIVDCKDYIGFSSVLKVYPVGYSAPLLVLSDEKTKHYNVSCCSPGGVYGFPTSMKESHYAYVLTDNPTMIEGKPAVLIPKSFLYRNYGKSYDTEPDMISQDALAKMEVSKDQLIRSIRMT